MMTTKLSLVLIYLVSSLSLYQSTSRAWNWLWTTPGQSSKFLHRQKDLYRRQPGHADSHLPSRRPWWAQHDIAIEFGISAEIAILSTALFVLGFAVGPMAFGPASEVVGRKISMQWGVRLCDFCIPAAVAKNAATVFVCRFRGGVWGSASGYCKYDPCNRREA